MRRLVLNVMVILGLIVYICNSVKIYKTALELSVLNDNIRYYAEQPINKVYIINDADLMTIEAQKDIEIRENNFYNSNDPVIRWFSNLYGFFKVLVLAFDVVFGIYAVKESFLFTVNTIFRLFHRRRHRKGYYRR